MLSQVAEYPDRLVAFCAVNPLRDYAVREITRCAANPRVKGIKLHLGNSRVNFRDTADIRALRAVFAAANARRLAVVVHLWTGPQYGENDARIFLDSVLPSAPNIPIQIAHLAGGGAFGSDAALGIFADAITAKDPRVRNLWFDVATDVTDEESPDTRARIAARLRQIGLRRVLYGSDTPVPGHEFPVSGWALFRRLPLTDDELRIVASNVAPYMR
jgi:predicted TIM-barrel fold metal-dependent hydrolase